MATERSEDAERCTCGCHRASWDEFYVHVVPCCDKTNVTLPSTLGHRVEVCTEHGEPECAACLADQDFTRGSLEGSSTPNAADG